MFPTPIQQRSHASQFSYQVFLPIALILWLLPLIAVMIFSIKPDGDFVKGNFWGLPSSFEFFNNYGRVFFASDMPQYLLNSVFITVPTVIGAVALSSMTGFALGVYKFRGNLLIFFMFIAGNFVPFQILMVPVRDLTVNLNLYDTKLGLILFHIAFQTGFCTLFMRNFIRALPYSLIEAARVEGVAEWKIFVYVVLPLMKPAIAALSVLIFTFIWNDYFWAIVLTQGPDAQPVTAGITAFNSQYRAAYHMMSAGSIVAAIPPVFMFFLMQKHFIAGLTLGAVKCCSFVGLIGDHKPFCSGAGMIWQRCFIGARACPMPKNPKPFGRRRDWIIQVACWMVFHRFPSVLKFPKPLRGIQECAYAPQRVTGLSHDLFS